MRQRPRRAFGPGLAVLALGLALGARAADPSPPQPSPDAEFLEFLGSVDPASDGAQPDDGSWVEYLSRTDINKVVRPAGTVVHASATNTDPIHTNDKLSQQ
jgi:hypothetical protein